MSFKKPLLLIPAICAMLASCATIYNKEQTKLTVHTAKDTVIVYNGMQFSGKRDKIKFSVPRQKEPVEFAILTDSTHKIIKVDAINSLGYYSNIIQNLGIGMLIEKNNPKRYGYPAHVYLDANGGISTGYRPNKKGDVLLHLSLPYVNNFYLKPDMEKPQSNTGFLGAAIGLDYFHSQKQFVNFSAGAVTDFSIPFPAPVDNVGEHELMSSIYLTLSNNHQLGKYSIGYGFAYARNSWALKYGTGGAKPPPTIVPVTRVNNALGLVFSSYYKLGPSFNIGAIYRPTFIRLNSTDKLKYEHLISIDLAWKIRLNK